MGVLLVLSDPPHLEAVWGCGKGEEYPANVLPRCTAGRMDLSWEYAGVAPPATVFRECGDEGGRGSPRKGGIVRGNVQKQQREFSSRTLTCTACKLMGVWDSLLLATRSAQVRRWGIAKGENRARSLGPHDPDFTCCCTCCCRTTLLLLPGSSPTVSTISRVAVIRLYQP